MRKATWVLAGLGFMLSACNQNTAIGNDREAHLDPVATPAAIEPAESALQNVATALIKPETMNPADIDAIGGVNGRCVFTLTEIAFPSFVYEPGQSGVIKLNGTLIPVEAVGPDRYVGGDLLVTTRELEQTGNAGLTVLELIVVPPGAKDELGYRGYVDCNAGNSRE